MGLLALGGLSRTGSRPPRLLVLQASDAPPLERVGVQLKQLAAGVHPHWKDVDTVLEEDPVLLPRGGLEVADLGSQNDPVAPRRHLPDEPGLCLQGPFVLHHAAVCQPEAVVADGGLEGSSLTQQASRQCRCTGARVLTTKSIRVQPAASQDPARSSVLPPKAARCPTRRDLAFLSSFRRFSRFLSFWCLAFFLPGVAFFSVGGRVFFLGRTAHGTWILIRILLQESALGSYFACEGAFC